MTRICLLRKLYHCCQKHIKPKSNNNDRSYAAKKVYKGAQKIVFEKQITAFHFCWSILVCLFCAVVVFCQTVSDLPLLRFASAKLSRLLLPTRFVSRYPIAFLAGRFSDTLPPRSPVIMSTRQLLLAVSMCIGVLDVCSRCYLFYFCRWPGVTR